MMSDPTYFGFAHSAAIDSVPAHIAILDSRGVISAVNEPWRKFAEANDLKGDYGVGTNYIEVCEQAAGSCGVEAKAVADGIRSVLNGSIPTFEIEYPCHSPSEQRWCRAMVSPLGGDPRSGAVVTHVDV